MAELNYQREVLVHTLVYHQQTNNSGCHCGWGQRPEHLGLSYAEHVADMYEQALEEDLSDCPYFRRCAGVPGADPDGSCSYSCQTEPSCITDRPSGGWPREAAHFARTRGSDG